VTTATSNDLRPVWAAIDLQALRHNYRTLKHLSHPGNIMPIVKGDAYGHGAVETVAAIWAEGGRDFGVAYLEEALELRESFPEARLLAMGPSLPNQAEAFLTNNVIPAIAGWDQAEAFSRAACQAGKTLGVHIKIDTGMGRLGLTAAQISDGTSEPALTLGDSPGSSLDIQSETPQETLPKILPVTQLILRIKRLPGIRLEGIYTHLADADETDSSFADEQWHLFEQIRTDLLRHNINIPMRHVANSAGILRWTGRQDRICEYSRPGILLYGISPSSDPSPPADFRPVLSLHAKITHLKHLPAGHSVSYNRTFVAPAPIQVALLPLGYADGLRRDLSNLGQVLIRGRRAPIIGRVCMDQTMVDVTDIPDAAVGDEAVLIGRSGQEEITAGEMAGWCRSIPYEIVCGISKRVPRLYIN
jgi:alanine racemase